MREFIYAPPTDPIPVLYEDAAFIIVDKPAGLLSVPGKHPEAKDCLESRMQAKFSDTRIVHRLDAATSGVMVLARTKHAHRHIGMQFEKRYVSKSYIADIWGQPAQKSGTIDLPLICDWPNRPLQKVDYENGKSAQTDWQVQETNARTSRMLLTPKTGRSHQLRVHMKELGHPIIGDQLYAHDEAYHAAARLHLHAFTLAFRHPDGGAHVAFSAASPF